MITLDKPIIDHLYHYGRISQKEYINRLKLLKEQGGLDESNIRPSRGQGVGGKSIR